MKPVNNNLEDDANDLPEKMEYLTVGSSAEEMLSATDEETSSNPWAEQGPDALVLPKTASVILEPEILEQSAKQLEKEKEKQATEFGADGTETVEVPKDVLNEFDPLADREEKEARDAWSLAESHPPSSPIAIASNKMREGSRQGTSSPGPSTSSSLPSTLASFLVPRSFSLARTKPRPQSQTIDSPPTLVSASSLQSFTVQQQQNSRSTGESAHAATTDQSGDQSPLRPVSESDKDKPPQFDFQKFLDQMKMRGAEPVAKYLRS